MRQSLKKKVLKTRIELKLRRPFSTEIDLRIDGIPQKAILQDKMHMKDFSDAIQKLEQRKVDFGENSNQEDYVHTEETVKKIHH